MEYQERECLQCEKLFEGRANKKFCSDTCRAKFHRENLEIDGSESDETDEEDDEQAGSREENEITWPGKVSLADKPESSNYGLTPFGQIERTNAHYGLDAIRLEQQRLRLQRIKEAEEEEAEEEAREVAKKMKNLHAIYSAVVTKCLKLDKEELDEDDLESCIDELDSASEKYLDHPGLQYSEDKANGRLQDLFWLRDKFNDLLTELREQEAKWFRQSEPVFLELSSKRKARLRTHLVA